MIVISFVLVKFYAFAILYVLIVMQIKLVVVVHWLSRAKLHSVKHPRLNFNLISRRVTVENHGSWPLGRTKFTRKSNNCFTPGKYDKTTRTKMTAFFIFFKVRKMRALFKSKIE